MDPSNNPYTSLSAEFRSKLAFLCPLPPMPPFSVTVYGSLRGVGGGEQFPPNAQSHNAL